MEAHPSIGMWFSVPVNAPVSAVETLTCPWGPLTVVVNPMLSDDEFRLIDSRQVRP